MVNVALINKEQCRAARAWLGITQQQLADASTINQKTIARFEVGSVIPHDRTLRDIQKALEAKGVEFLFDGARGIGLKATEPGRQTINSISTDD